MKTIRQLACGFAACVIAFGPAQATCKSSRSGGEHHINLYEPDGRITAVFIKLDHPNCKLYVYAWHGIAGIECELDNPRHRLGATLNIGAGDGLIQRPDVTLLNRQHEQVNGWTWPTSLYTSAKTIGEPFVITGPVFTGWATRLAASYRGERRHDIIFVNLGDLKCINISMRIETSDIDVSASNDFIMSVVKALSTQKKALPDWLNPLTGTQIPNFNQLKR